MNSPYGDMPDIRLPDTTITAYAGTRSPNCLCLSTRHPQCPQHPGHTARGEVA